MHRIASALSRKAKLASARPDRHEWGSPRTGLLPALPTPRGGVRILLFAYGAAQFFVDPEPGPVDLMFPLLLLFINQRAVLHPAYLLLLGSNVFALSIEWLLFGTVKWSIISLYLTIASAALYSILSRYDFVSCVRVFLMGGVLGSALTLGVLLTPFASSAYKFGIRFTGFFKDPNVAAPTALFFVIMLLGLSGRSRLLALIPAVVMYLPLSRATFLAAVIALLCAVFFRSFSGAVIGALVAALAALLSPLILDAFDRFFYSIGRGGITNSYDEDRSSNWESLLHTFWANGAPLGPGYSESNGYSTHSTYLRLLVEQGPVSLIMFSIALLIALRAARTVAIRASLVALLANGVVLDATHWRVLFVAIAIALASQSRGVRASRTPER